tara:strand:- start:75 stop:224 length:150 start_codon:yes stop_codon:yes gene_type:complete
MFKFNDTIKGLREWYARFRGRKFYNRVRKVYQRSHEIKGNKYYRGGIDG